MEAFRAPASDKALRWLFGVLAVGIAIEALSGPIAAAWDVLALPAVLLAVVLLTVPSKGALRWERYGNRRWATLLALISVSALVSAVVQEILMPVPDWRRLPPVVIMYLISLLLCWTTLDLEDGVFQVSIGLGGLLAGVSLTIGGFQLFRELPWMGLGAVALGIALCLLGTGSLAARGSESPIVSDLFIVAFFVMFGLGLCLAGFQLLVASIPWSADSLFGMFLVASGCGGLVLVASDKVGSSLGEWLGFGLVSLGIVAVIAASIRPEDVPLQGLFGEATEAGKAFLVALFVGLLTIGVWSAALCLWLVMPLLRRVTDWLMAPRSHSQSQHGETSEAPLQ